MSERLLVGVCVKKRAASGVCASGKSKIERIKKTIWDCNPGSHLKLTGKKVIKFDYWIMQRTQQLAKKCAFCSKLNGEMRK